MKKKKEKYYGECRICGQYKELSAEHIPPKNAFNSGTVRVLPFDEVVKAIGGADGRMPWDFTGLHGSLQQGGYKRYCLCHSCNNKTGTWYMRAYTELAKTIHNMIAINSLTVGSSYSFVIKNLYPLRVYKAMLTMICDLNNNCFGDEQLRHYIMNKEDRHINTSKYSLYMYLVSTQMPRMHGLAAIANIFDTQNAILVSEMAQYPIGFALYIDKPKSYTPFGLNADVFSTFDYGEKCDIRFTGMPYLDINSQLPADYRPKETFIRRATDSEKQNGE